MRNIIMGLIVLSVLAFVLAIISHFAGAIADVGGRGFSLVCTNLALIAIALSVCVKDKTTKG